MVCPRTRFHCQVAPWCILGGSLVPPWCLPGASLVPPWCLLGASPVPPRCRLAPIDLVPGSILDLQVRNLSLPMPVLDPKVCNLSHLRTNLHQLWTNLSQLKMNFGQLRINLSLLWAIPAPYKAQVPLKTIVFHGFLYVFHMSAPNVNL